MSAAIEFRRRLMSAADDLMTRVNERKLCGEMSGEAFHEIDRTVLAAGASDGNRQVTAIGF